MNSISLTTWIALAATSGMAPQPATAQYIKGNEAVVVAPDGTRRVETPPVAGALLGKPCPAADPACSGGAWKMVETADGLQECTEFYARPGTCRASTYGTEKRSRVWVVKKGGQWMQCQLATMSSSCVSLKSLPITAVQ